MLKVNNISFSYPNNKDDKLVLKDLDFQVKQGENLSIIGESGSGKSTLLKLLYGEYDLSKGSIHWNSTEILGPKFNLVVGYDFMKYVAQEFDLMPYITVSENIGKYLSNFYPAEKKERIAELLDVVELTAFANTKVKTLSGGQKQRVALARALAKQPEIMLLDEPFSHIDNFQKQSLRRKLFSYLKDKNITSIVATHDREDVLGFADTMMVLHNSKILAHQTPQQLFNNPENFLIASFFGEFNQIDNHIIYAHQLQITENSPLKVLVKKSYFKGKNYLIESKKEDQTILFENESALEPHTEVCLKINSR